MKTIDIRSLYENCIYSSIAHAVYTLDNPFFSYSQSWDGKNYSFHYGSSRGTLFFDEEKDTVIGAMRNEDSERIALYPDRMNADDLFRNAPEEIQKAAAAEPLMYLYDSIGDYTGPVATTGFWILKNQMILCDEEDVFLSQGGAFLDILLNDIAEIRKYWKEEYSLTGEQIRLIDDIFSIYLQNGREVRLSRSWKAMTGKPGYSEMLECFEEIGLTIKIKTGLF